MTPKVSVAGVNCTSCGRAIPAGTSSCAFCATGSGPLPFQLPKLSGYEFLRQLGEGGMGSVYLANEITLNRLVAIKVISERFSGNENAMARFLREARAMATVEHPHIVRVYTLGHTEEQTYLAMEYVEGENLAQRIKRLSELSIPECLHVLRQVAEALAAGWEKSIVHRDIKPSNILIDKKGDVHVADFGLAKPIEMKAEEESITTSGMILGTPHYISSEQALGQKVDLRSDIYSLGIVLFEMLTGEKPFDGQTPFEIVNKHLTAPLPSLRERRPDVPGNVATLVEWMTQKNPNHRPQTYPALLKAIDSCIEGESLEMIGKMQILRRTLTSQKLRLAAGFILVLVLALIVQYKFQANKSMPRAPTTVKTSGMVAIAPFYGPDEDSAKEGKLMGALIEKKIREQMSGELTVIGTEQTLTPLRSYESALALGRRLHTSIVVWGEAIHLRNETEIQPYFTIVPEQKSFTQIKSVEEVLQENLFTSLAGSTTPIVMEGESPNQIELRKVSAEKISDVVLLFAGVHSLYSNRDPAKALKFFQQLPSSPESYYYSARALLQMGKSEEALAALQKALELMPQYAQAHALRGDYKLSTGDFQNAVADYRAAYSSGQSYTASRAFYRDGKLFMKEFFRSEKYTHGQEQETSWLITVDPASEGVLERYHLPGVPRVFVVRKDSVEVLYDDGSGTENTWILSDSKSERPLYGEQDLLLRMRTMQSGWGLASSFLADWENGESIGTTKFEPGNILYSDAPTTLSELESRERSAIAHDRTQPWNSFFLGQALWAQGKKDEAEKIWLQLKVEAYAATPYFEFSWMASMFEAYGQTKMADHAYQQALLLRQRLPVPVDTATRLERLINANFLRTAAYASRNEMSPERAHEWLMRARQLTGICPEGDDFASASWQKYFVAVHKPDRAQVEGNYFQRTQQNPLSIIRATTLFDYALYIWIAATTAFIVLCLLLFFKATRFLFQFDQQQAVLARKGFVSKVAIGLILIISALCFLKIIEMQSMELVALGLSLAAFLFLLLRSKKISLRSFLSSISPPERWILAISFLIMLATLPLPVYFNCIAQNLLKRPAGASDTPDNIPLLQYMEERLKQTNSRDIRYATAVLNHEAGNIDRAKMLYETLLNEPGAQQNLMQIESGSSAIPVRLTSNDIYRACVSVPWETFIQRIWEPGNGLNILDSGSAYSFEKPDQEDFGSGFFQIFIMLSVLLFLAFYLIPAQPQTNIRLSDNFLKRTMGKSLFFLLPGSYDIEEGHPFRGFITLLLFVFALFALVTVSLIPSHFPVPGIFTFLQMPHDLYLNSAPFPVPNQHTDVDSVMTYQFWTIFWAYLYAKIFWALVGVSAVTALSLHILRLRTIWRTP